PPHTETPTRSLHDALPISGRGTSEPDSGADHHAVVAAMRLAAVRIDPLLAEEVLEEGQLAAELHRRQPAEQQPDRAVGRHAGGRSEEHTSELQSRENLVCR